MEWCTRKPFTQGGKIAKDSQIREKKALHVMPGSYDLEVIHLYIYIYIYILH